MMPSAKKPERRPETSRGSRLRSISEPKGRGAAAQTAPQLLVGRTTPGGPTEYPCGKSSTVVTGPLHTLTVHPYVCRRTEGPSGRSGTVSSWSYCTYVQSTVRCTTINIVYVSVYVRTVYGPVLLGSRLDVLVGSRTPARTQTHGFG